MHEVSIAEGILQAASNTPLEAGEKISRVRIAVGELAGVDLEALKFAWVSVCRGSAAEGSTLDIEQPPGVAWCMGCGKNVPLHRHGDPCPECGSYQLLNTGGHELKVLDLEISSEE